MSWPQFKLEKEDLLDLNQKQSLEILKELGGIEEIASGVGSNLNEGLSKQEAETQFIERKQRYGENVYPEPPHKNIFQLFIESLKDTTIIILIVSAIISLILGILVPGEEGSQSGWIEGAAILMAVLIVAWYYFLKQKVYFISIIFCYSFLVSLQEITIQRKNNFEV